MTPGHEFSKEFTSLQPPFTAKLKVSTPLCGTHSVEGDGIKKVGVALYPLRQTQPMSQRRPVPDREITIKNNIASNDARSLTDNTQNKYTYKSI